jgi:hypothetical protein
LTMAARGGDALPVQLGGDATQRRYSGRAQLGNDGCKVGHPRVDARCNGLAGVVAGVCLLCHVLNVSQPRQQLRDAAGLPLADAARSPDTAFVKPGRDGP